MRAVITGGNGDIAKATERLLLLKGIEVLVPDRKELDVSCLLSVRHFFGENTPLSILVNCAGYIHPENIASSDAAKWIQQIDVNLIGTYLCSREILLQNAGAIIINVASSAGTNPRGGWSAYCASKAGVISLTKCLAEEGAKVVCVSPGRTKTKMRRALYGDENENSLLTPEQVALEIVNGIQGLYEWGSNKKVSKC